MGFNISNDSIESLMMSTEFGSNRRRGAMQIADVARRIQACIANGDCASDCATAWRWLLQFTDDFRGSSPSARQWMTNDPPPLVGLSNYDAAIAGLVEHLCAQYRVEAPPWTCEETRFAKPWWFPANLPALRARALRESPISLKRHGVLVTAEAFDRV